MFPDRNNRLSLQNRPNDKGKAPLRGDALANGDSNPTDNLPHDRVRPSSVSSTPPSNGFNLRKNRNSIIGAASDALSLRFGRKTRPVLRQAPLPIILPDVIEISAPPPDQEVEERNRLREMAAQAIGISPFIVHPDSYSQEDSTEDEDEVALRTPVDASELRRFGDTRNSESTPDIRNKSFLETSSINTANPMRFRSGSVVSHSRHNSIAFTPVPTFPTNVLSLNPFLACSAYFPKYTQPSSLRRFALASKNWKTRYIILSTPSNSPSRNLAPAISYLHLFKSSGPDDKEQERLQIHTDSAVFVADEEIGGRRNVIRIKGFEVVPGKAGSNGVHEATWNLHIIDPVESQKWISTIKSAILGQRTIAAGFGLSPTPTGSEPRGDLDVIMKMRAQSPATATPKSVVYDAQPRSPTDLSYASSISSQSVRSQATVPKPAPSGTVATIKGLFTSRSRAGSRATSVESERHKTERDQAEGSFASMGTNLMGMIQSPTPDIQSTLTPLNTPIQQRNTLPFTPTDRRADRKILAERQPEQWVNVPVLSDKNRSSRALSLGALSLQPPPRRRWASLRPTSTNDEHELKLIDPAPPVSSSRPPNERAETEPPSSPVDFTSMTPVDSRPRASSIQSVSTYGSENTKKSSSSTKRTSKRWSRQLPQRLTPPSGPPPDIPASASTSQLNVPQYGPERPPSTTSTTSGQSRQSVVSNLPTFSKRASTSSSQSVGSTSTAQNSVSSSSSSRAHRASMPPPPRPAPTSALPLVPDQDTTAGTASASGKSSLRNSMTQRALRISMIDEAEFVVGNKKHHRHSTSSARSQTLDTIPEPSKHPASPFPPPIGPLPPTPGIGDNIPTVSRHSSLKHRNLSAPSLSNGPTSLPSSRPTTMISTTLMHSTPPTPTAEKTMTFSHDQQQSFLQMNTTPTLANLVPPRMFERHRRHRHLEGGQDDSMELLDDVITPLGPPPRRGSKHIIVPVPQAISPTTSASTAESISSAGLDAISRSSSTSARGCDHDDDDDDDDRSAAAETTPSRQRVMPASTTADKETTTHDPLRVFSLSPPGSVVSLGVVSL